MSVELEPLELGFQRPFTREVTETLRIKNPSSQPIAFKVKTTAPKQYCVRPNSGRVEAGQVVEVQVLLQAMKEDPPLEIKCRDKFLVQSVGITSDKEFSNITQAWSHIEQTDKSSIHERKIRVSFLPASGTSVVGGFASTPARSSLGPADGQAATYSSPLSNAATPQTHSTPATGIAPVGAVSKPESRPSDAKNLGEIRSSTSNPATQSIPAAAGGAIAGAAATVAAAVPTNQQELQAQLEEAKATIARLTRQAQEQTGLRQRKTESTTTEARSAPTSGSAMGIQQAPGGVPVPIVAALCLLSFLLAYLLF